MIRKLAAAIGAMALCAGLVISPADSASAQSKKLIIGVPGIPPIFSAVLVYVAEREGLFKKYGADVELKPFDTGTAAARAVTAGDIDVAISPSPLIANQISNAGVGLIAIYGFPKPDWVLASTDATKASCNDVTGQPVGVDAAGAARSIALKQMLIGCGSKIEDVQQVALSSNTAPAMIAGRLTFGVLHLDDIAAIEAQGKKVTIIVSMQKTNPNDHYLLAVAQIDQVKQNRDAYVRMVAGLIAASRFMQQPANLDRVAAIATVTGHSEQDAKAALRQFLDFGLWPVDEDGLDRSKLESVIATQLKVGGILAGKTPVTYERLVDRSIWRDAAALVDNH